MALDWTRWPNFQPWEFECSHTGKCEMNEAFMDRLQRLRERLNMPLVITSGYRDPSHPIEIAKPEPGVHTLGRAVDIAADSQAQYRIMKAAVELGFTGFGFSRTFIHIDDWGESPRPNVWTYKE